MSDEQDSGSSWIARRFGCNIDTVFHDLRCAAKRDMEAMNNVLGRDKPYAYKLDEKDEYRFVIYRTSQRAPMRAIDITQAHDAIEIESDRRTDVRFQVSVEWDAESDRCRYLVTRGDATVEASIDEIARLALHPLFFDEPWI